MDISLSTLDRVLAFLGFALTIWQLYLTRAAAYAARKAANEATTAIKDLEAITKMYDVSSRTRELLRLLRVGTFPDAAAAAFELRDTVARYNDPNSKVVIVQLEWTLAVDNVRELHEKLESLATTPRTRAKDRELLVVEVARLHTYFTRLAAKA